MAVSATLYGPALRSLAEGRANLNADALKMVLLKGTYVPNQDTHQFLSDLALATNEVAPSSTYVAGGVPLAWTAPTVRLAYDAATNRLTFDADDVSIANSTITARYAVIYDATPATDATRPLLVLIDFGADVISSSGTFAVTFAATGVFSITAA